MEQDARRKKLHFRSWHRGTREADYLMGGFFDAHQQHWDEADLQWFEALIEEQDVDILSWAFGQSEPPPRYQGPMLSALRRLDYISIPR